MQRTYILLIALVVLLTAYFVVENIASSQKISNEGDKATHKTFSLSDAGTFFQNFAKKEGAESESSTENDSNTTSLDDMALEKIIHDWETRNGSERAQTAFTTLDNSRKNGNATESLEIKTLFDDLVGESLLSQLSQEENSAATDETSTIWLGEYANSQTTLYDDELSETQKELHAYGNKLATLLTGFTIAQGNQLTILDAFLGNNEDTTALKKLSESYIQLAKDIRILNSPIPLEKTHADLSTSYKEVGELLWNLSLATNDEELVERMLTYNTASEEVVKNQLVLITTLKAYAVTFKAYEPGSIFMFSPSTTQ